MEINNNKPKFPVLNVDQGESFGRMVTVYRSVSLYTGSQHKGSLGSVRTAAGCYKGRRTNEFEFVNLQKISKIL